MGKGGNANEFVIGVIAFISVIVLSAVGALMQPLCTAAAIGLAAVMLSLLVVVVLAWDAW
jgi:hypothetical protein